MLRFLTHEDPIIRDLIKNPLTLSKRSRNRIPKRIREEINSRLNDANGKRRIRLLNIDDILHPLRKLIESPKEKGQLFKHAGHVANCYKYPAIATTARILKFNNWILITISTGNAKKGCTGFGRTDLQHNLVKCLQEYDEEKDLLIKLK